MVVFINDGIKELGVVVLFDPEGLGHEGRVDAVLAGHVFKFFHGLGINGPVLYFFEVA